MRAANAAQVKGLDIDRLRERCISRFRSSYVKIPRARYRLPYTQNACEAARGIAQDGGSRSGIRPSFARYSIESNGIMRLACVRCVARGSRDLARDRLAISMKNLVFYFCRVTCVLHAGNARSFDAQVG